VRELLVILLFSHHAPEQHDHCLFLPLPGGRRLPLCARCLGIYPMMLVVLALQLTGRLDLAWTDPWLMILLPLPTVIEFLGEQTGRVQGSNRLRILTGLPLGVALGRMFLRYFQDPFDPVFWALVAAYGGTCGLTAAFVLRRRFASGRDP
jgi:uncharacterized membrane protein